MSNLYGVIGVSTPDHLLADPVGADTISIPMEPGNDTVKRGTVVYRKATGLWAPATAGDVVTTNMLAVLNEEVDTNAGAEDEGNQVAETAAAYRMGKFIAGRVTLADDAALTDAHRVVLALHSIVFDVTTNADEFENSTSAD